MKDNLERRIENIELALFGRTGNYWHGTKELEDGVMIGCCGAMEYIIDPELKRPISKGYHHITVYMPNTLYDGETGAKEERFMLNTFDHVIKGASNAT